MANPTPATTYGTYTSVEVISAAAQTEQIANVNSLKALIPDPDTGVAANRGIGSDFDQIPPKIAWQLRHELDQLAAAIDAAPTV